MSGAALPDAQIRVVWSWRSSCWRPRRIDGGLPGRRTNTASPAGALACTTPARRDAWHFTVGGAGATIQSFTAVPRSTSTASSGSPLRKGVTFTHGTVYAQPGRRAEIGGFLQRIA
jgi:hypothetical protein